MIKCRFEHGSVAFLRHVTVRALIVRAQRLLLVKRSATSSVEAGKWALPGGYLDRDESGAQAIVREVLEETGYEAEVVSLFRLIDMPRMKGDDRQNVELAYLVRVFEQTQKPDHEVSDIQWFKLDALPKEGDIAFDHMDTIELLLEHLNSPKTLPIIN